MKNYEIKVGDILWNVFDADRSCMYEVRIVAFNGNGFEVYPARSAFGVSSYTSSFNLFKTKKDAVQFLYDKKMRELYQQFPTETMELFGGSDFKRYWAYDRLRRIRESKTL